MSKTITAPRTQVRNEVRNSKAATKPAPKSEPKVEVEVKPLAVTPAPEEHKARGSRYAAPLPSKLGEVARDKKFTKGSTPLSLVKPGTLRYAVLEAIINAVGLDDAVGVEVAKPNGGTYKVSRTDVKWALANGFIAQ